MKHIIYSLIVCLLFITSNGVASENSKQSLVVIGVSHDIKDPRWNDQLIGYGINKLVFQKLYDTGKYTVYEDNKEIVSKVNRLISSQWQHQQPPYNTKQTMEISQALGCDVVAYAKITRFSLHRLHGFAAIFAAASTTIYFDIELHLTDKNGNHSTYKGTGSASTESTGTFFQVREDTIYFDKTGVGQSISLAVQDAVDKME